MGKGQSANLSLLIMLIVISILIFLQLKLKIVIAKHCDNIIIVHHDSMVTYTSTLYPHSALQ